MKSFFYSAGSILIGLMSIGNNLKAQSADPNTEITYKTVNVFQSHHGEWGPTINLRTNTDSRGYWRISGPMGPLGNKLGFYYNEAGKDKEVFLINATGHVGLGVINTDGFRGKLHSDGDIQGTAAYFHSTSRAGAGVAIGVDWPEIFFNGYRDYSKSPQHARVMSNSGYTASIQADQTKDGGGGLNFYVSPTQNTVADAASDVAVKMKLKGNGEFELYGKERASHFYNGASQDVIIRGGLNNGRVILNDNGGYVAIGFNPNVNAYRVAPGYNLAVKGKVVCEEIRVQTAAQWPDYVFDKNYKLESLQSVENFIEKNNHLPEVPSAKEVKENGIIVGEMNAILLKKVEELTLHLIQQQKEIELLKEENKIIKTSLKASK